MAEIVTKRAGLLVRNPKADKSHESTRPLQSLQGNGMPKLGEQFDGKQLEAGRFKGANCKRQA